MSTVLFRGGVLTQSGYGVHGRQIFRYALEACKDRGHELETHILPWGDTPWILNPDMCDGLIGEAMSRSVEIDEENVTKKYDVTLQLQLPHEWNTKLGRINIGITAGIETDKCRQDWIEACRKMTKVVVPSTFSKQVFIDSTNDNDVKRAFDKKIVVIPEAFPDEFLKKHDKKSFNYELSENNVLIVGQITGLNANNDRKNLFYTLRWLCESLLDNEKWGIVVKTNAARNTKIDRQIVLNMFKQLVGEIRPNRVHPKIHLIHGTLSDSELMDLYCDSRVKTYVSLTRGEGYGLPILEAAACGLPIIATNWSGHLDFLQDQFMKIPYEMVNVPDSDRSDLFVQGCKWANPDQSEFKRSLMSFIKNNQFRRTQVNQSKRLKSRVRKNYSFESIKKIYEKELGEYLK